MERRKGFGKRAASFSIGKEGDFPSFSPREGGGRRKDTEREEEKSRVLLVSPPTGKEKKKKKGVRPAFLGERKASCRKRKESAVDYALIGRRKRLSPCRPCRQEVT